VKIIRMKLTPDDISNPTQRYNADCDCTQTLVGDAWMDNPAIDPRTSSALLLPAPTRSDPACSAATAITNNFRDGLTGALNNLNTTGNVLGAGSVILTILDFLDGVGLLIQLFVDFCSLILSIGTEAVGAAFDDSVYADLQCILFCDASPDGTFTEAQFDQVLMDIVTAFGEFSTVNIILNSWLNNLGFVGLTNVGIVKSAAGDCDDCGCSWCYTWDFTVNDGGWENGLVASYEPGVGWVGSEFNGTSNTHCEIKLTFPTAANVTGFGYTGCKPTGSGVNNNTFFELTLGGSDVYTNVIGIDEGCPVSNGVSMSVTADQAVIALNAGTSGGPTTITSVTLTGTGTNPFGDDNC